MNNLFKLGIKKIFFLIKNKKISYFEIIKVCINNLSKLNDKNYFVLETLEKESLKIAKKLDNTNPKILSIPISIKNIYSIKNKLLSCNSKILKNYFSTYNSSIIKIIKKYNLIVISLDKLEEFCIGESGKNNCINIKNIYSNLYLPGGSSSGSAISVSSGCVIGSIGSDTGGSIRTPAIFSNLIGFKPTYGKISRNGMVPYSSSLDCCSIITNYSSDCKFLYNILSTKNLDLLSFKKYLYVKYNKIKIIALLFDNLYYDYESKKKFEKVILNFKILNYTIIFKKIDLSVLFYEYTILSSKEFYTNSCRYDGIKFGYKKNIFKNINDFTKLNRCFYKTCKNKILLGVQNFYLKNQKIKINKKILNFFNELFIIADFLIIPSLNNFKIDNINYSEYCDYITVFSNLIGYPSITIPIGMINHKPFGFNIIGELQSDNLILELAIRYEKFFLNNYVSI
ncbi:aspartyl/glutamyl-tRNA amidotransferase A subunit [Candidatus Carsonella ruddii PV]|uniref:Aspartyl/glutamyl-tRNA amidotransferase A subunit n=1 Tax=Carsonella ruddii (strain PV) TaxID=387662 RepID=Q05FU7_CARRP|nr:amidase family protein [Candidatus Carsonella ruddii]BAF35074.1 aspartyl/glutamyl-tRNA amidotransferase A subunit [Candidatus Carsonella ruddii PV]